MSACVDPGHFSLPVFLLLTLFSLSGCVRVYAAMAVSDDDRISGEIVAATPPTQDNDPGPAAEGAAGARRAASPPSRTGWSRTSGTQLFFNGLTFEEMRTLSHVHQLVEQPLQHQLPPVG